MPLGGLALQDLSGGSLKKAQKIIRNALERAPEYLEHLHGRTFYAVGGTWRALARLHQAATDYPLHVMHAYTIDPRDSLDFLHLVEEADTKTLKDIESISEARRPLLAYGAILLEEIIRLGQAEGDRDLGLRRARGHALSKARCGNARARSAHLTAAEDLNLLRSRSPGMAEELWALDEPVHRIRRTCRRRNPSGAFATPPAFSPISAGAPIPITGASRAST